MKESIIDGVRETSCTGCIHRNMCKYKELYLQVIRELQEVNIHSNEEGRIRLIPITSLEFLIQPIVLECRYFCDECVHEKVF